VPTALLAAVTATQRVRSDSTASTASAGSSRVPGSGSAKRTVAPARSAAMTHGEDVRVVVEPGAHDLVAGSELAADRRGEAHRQRGHARPEGDAARVAAQQPPDGLARGLDELVRRRGGPERAAVVGVVAAAHEAGHRIDGGVDHLRAGRAVEAGPAVAQAGEALADGRERGRGRPSASRAPRPAAGAASRGERVVDPSLV
jgi:hypothetical protein